jgi:prolyl 4-hydroxylase
MAPAGRLTPDLRRWIIAQAEAGHPPEVMLKSMTDAGWTEAAALDALESTLRLKIESRSPPTPKPPSGPTR